jgi:diaminohydroxyphosphoribosylaminopyrimidine deaminase/5-amino-6-(5-phosphoribosylamino)uracil reductase
MANDDLRFMKMALRLARRGRGFTEPNPMVGAVVVKDGRVLGAGFHARCGAMHAETMALRHLAVPGATLYLTLEPCSHFGKTPPCADLIVRKKVGRVVMAMLDPNPLVNGAGLARLRAAGIAAEVGICRAEAERLNRHYLTFMRAGRPWVALHAGVSLDGKMTDREGRSRWVTPAELRRFSHSLRGEFAAVMAGSGTVLADDPLLTLREPGWQGKALCRVVLDTAGSLPRDRRILRDQERFPLVLFSGLAAAGNGRKAERQVYVPADGEELDLDAVLQALAGMGIASLLVEGGGRLIDSFLRRGLWDEAVFFYSGRIVGGRAAVQPFASGAGLDAAPELAERHWSPLANGAILRGYRCSPA